MGVLVGGSVRKGSRNQKVLTGPASRIQYNREFNVATWKYLRSLLGQLKLVLPKAGEGKRPTTEGSNHRRSGATS